MERSVRLVTFTAALALFMMAIPARADYFVVNVNFVDRLGRPAFTEGGVLPTGGTTWNALLPANGSLNATALVDSYGNPTSVGFTAANLDTFSNSTPVPNNALLANYLFVNSHDKNALATGNFSITGLTPGQSYSLSLFGIGDQAGQGAVFTINGNSLSTTGRPYRISPVFTNGLDFVRFDGVTANGTGQITGSWSNLVGISQYGAFNGFEISKVPEPSAMVLAAVGAVGVVAARRRLRRQTR
jgi:hypothetical protein